MPNKKIATRMTRTFVAYTPKLHVKKPLINNKQFIFNSCISTDKTTAALIIAAVTVSHLAFMANAMSMNSENVNAQKRGNNGENNFQANNRNSQAMCRKFEETRLKLQTKCPNATPQENRDYRVLFFSKHSRAGVHPGLYMVPNNIRSVEEWRRMQQFGIDVAIQKGVIGRDLHSQRLFAQIYAKVLRKTFEIDQTYNEAGPEDRLYHDQALNWLEKKILPTPFEKLGLKAQHAFIKKLNYMISAPDERSFVDPLKKQSLYRTKESNIRKSRAVPDLHKGDDWLEFLRKNDPANVEVYKKFGEYNNEFVGMGSAQRGDWLEFIDKKGNKKVSALLRKYFHWNPKPNKILELMDQFFKTLNEELHALKQGIKKDPLEVAAFAHMGLTAIHPFNDANGRTARALMNVILVQHGIEPVAFLSNEAYSKVVTQAAEENNFKIFEDFLRAEVLKATKAASELDEMEEEMEVCVKTRKDDECQGLLTAFLQRMEGIPSLKESVAKPAPPKAHRKEPTTAQKKAAKMRELRRKK